MVAEAMEPSGQLRFDLVLSDVRMLRMGRFSSGAADPLRVAFEGPSSRSLPAPTPDQRATAASRRFQISPSTQKQYFYLEPKYILCPLLTCFLHP